MDILTVIGFLGKDAELRYTPEGSVMCQFPVAATKKWKNKEGETKSRTNWYRCTLWGKRGEALLPYLEKGTRVCVVGRLSGDEYGGPRVWQAQDGSNRASFEVMVSEIELLGKGSHERQEEAQPVALGSEDDFDFGGGEIGF